MTPEEFFKGWEKRYIEKFGSPPSFGRGFLLDQAEEMIEAIRTDTPIPELPTKDVCL